MLKRRLMLGIAVGLISATVPVHGFIYKVLVAYKDNKEVILCFDKHWIREEGETVIWHVADKFQHDLLVESAAPGDWYVVEDMKEAVAELLAERTGHTTPFPALERCSNAPTSGICRSLRQCIDVQVKNVECRQHMFLSAHSSKFSDPTGQQLIPLSVEEVFNANQRVADEIATYRDSFADFHAATIAGHAVRAPVIANLVDEIKRLGCSDWSFEKLLCEVRKEIERSYPENEREEKFRVVEKGYWLHDVSFIDSRILHHIDCWIKSDGAGRLFVCAGSDHLEAVTVQLRAIGFTIDELELPIYDGAVDVGKITQALSARKKEKHELLGDHGPFTAAHESRPS